MVISVINNKGGSGKTTTCVNLAVALAKKGNRVLLVDLDSQAAASLSVGIPRNDLSPSTADVLFGYAKAKDVIRATEIPELDVMTGSMDLANTDLELANVRGRERVLARGLAPVNDHYDFIICDCPPSLSLLSVNAMVATQRYIVPVPPEYLALEALIGLLRGIDKMRRGIGIKCELLGILLTFIDHSFIKNRTSKEVVKLIREHYGEKVFRTEIRRDRKLAEAPAYGESVFEFAPGSKGANDYEMLAKEVISKCG